MQFGGLTCRHPPPAFLRLSTFVFAFDFLAALLLERLRSQLEPFLFLSLPFAFTLLDRLLLVLFASLPLAFALSLVRDGLRFRLDLSSLEAAFFLSLLLLLLADFFLLSLLLLVLLSFPLLFEAAFPVLAERLRPRPFLSFPLSFSLSSRFGSRSVSSFSFSPSLSLCRSLRSRSRSRSRDLSFRFSRSRSRSTSSCLSFSLSRNIFFCRSSIVFARISAYPSCVLPLMWDSFPCSSWGPPAARAYRTPHTSQTSSPGNSWVCLSFTASIWSFTAVACSVSSPALDTDSSAFSSDSLINLSYLACISLTFSCSDAGKMTFFPPEPFSLHLMRSRAMYLSQSATSFSR
mmetsp:Transcript_30979/g.89228  ORF Transcript_30979/g.89228 Transcript_30979/m.89228 type:complete len:347 (-) Transcript_30979:361-1401(-)